MRSSLMYEFSLLGFALVLLNCNSSDIPYSLFAALPALRSLLQPSSSRSSPNPCDTSGQPLRPSHAASPSLCRLLQPLRLCLNPYFNNAATVDATLKPDALPSNSAKKKRGGPKKYSLMTTLLWTSHQVRPLQGGANFVAPGYTEGDGLGVEIVGIFVIVYMFSHYAMDFLGGTLFRFKCRIFNLKCLWDFVSFHLS
ncbi:hypothetical protein Fmac_014743 [Flemingia macrophylla]|uniref:Uncharacterized protein n=1 Tax=Flemingia macrophylla TaxID=520843 RepID=A0ABD1MEL5_9FABA